MELDPDFEIIKRRFIYEGTSQDDSRLNYLIKVINNWVHSNTSNSDNERFYNLALQQLAACEASMKKSLIVEKRIKNEIAMYENIQRDMQDKIVDVKDDIVTSEELYKDLTINSDFLKIDEAIITEIKKYPSCEELNKTVCILKNDLQFSCKSVTILIEQINCVQEQYNIITDTMNNLMKSK